MKSLELLLSKINSEDRAKFLKNSGKIDEQKKEAKELFYKSYIENDFFRAESIAQEYDIIDELPEFKENLFYRKAYEFHNSLNQTEDMLLYIDRAQLSVEDLKKGNLKIAVDAVYRGIFSKKNEYNHLSKEELFDEIKNNAIQMCEKEFNMSQFTGEELKQIGKIVLTKLEDRVQAEIAQYKIDRFRRWYSTIPKIEYISKTLGLLDEMTVTHGRILLNIKNGLDMTDYLEWQKTLKSPERDISETRLEIITLNLKEVVAEEEFRKAVARRMNYHTDHKRYNFDLMQKDKDVYEDTLDMLELSLKLSKEDSSLKSYSAELAGKLISYALIKKEYLIAINADLFNESNLSVQEKENLYEQTFENFLGNSPDLAKRLFHEKNLKNNKTSARIIAEKHYSNLKELHKEYVDFLENSFEMPKETINANAEMAFEYLVEKGNYNEAKAIAKKYEQKENIALIESFIDVLNRKNECIKTKKQ